MKKIILASTLVACAAVVTAQTVTSANVVGYAKEATPAPGGFTIVSLNILGEADTVDIQDAIANLDDLNASTAGNAGGDVASADKIYVWSGTGYATYGLYDDTSSNYWMSTASLGWGKSAKASPSAQVLTRGDSVWFETGIGATASELMTAGEVPNDGTYEIDVDAFSLIAYPYASSINLQSLVVSNAASSTAGNNGGDVANADKIYVWSGSGYATYGLYDSGTEKYWMSTASLGWGKAAKASPSDADLELGTGVWYESVDGSKTIGFTQNYNLD